jgi:hypothetical protein
MFYLILNIDIIRYMIIKSIFILVFVEYIDIDIRIVL